MPVALSSTALVTVRSENQLVQIICFFTMTSLRTLESWSSLNIFCARSSADFLCESKVCCSVLIK